MAASFLDNVIESLNREVCGTFVEIKEGLEEENFNVIDSEYRFDDDIRHLKGDRNVERIVQQYSFEDTYAIVGDWLANLSREREEHPRCEAGNIYANTEGVEESLEVQLFMIPANYSISDTGYHAEVTWNTENPVKINQLENVLRKDGMEVAELTYDDSTETLV